MTDEQKKSGFDWVKELLKNKLVQSLVALGIISVLAALGLKDIVAEKLCPAVTIEAPINPEVK